MAMPCRVSSSSADDKLIHAYNRQESIGESSFKLFRRIAFMYPQIEPTPRRRLSTESSEQLGWITGERGTVLEEGVDRTRWSTNIVYRARCETLQIDGGRLRASNFQPLFHVEHAAGGSVDDPPNFWRIVILKPKWDERYTEPFEEMAREGLLPAF
jgi:hypothetical protein